MEENPDSPDLVFIENIKTSYTRILIEQLNNIGEIEIEDWINYAILISLKVKSQVTKILSENPILKEGYKNFLSRCGEKVRELLSNLANGK